MSASVWFKWGAGGLAALAVAAGAWSAATGGIMATLLRGPAEAEATIAALRAWFDAWGHWAPLAYLLIVVIEVIVAPLPGAMLYAPGGVIFGGFWGGSLALAGNVIGAGLACVAMRQLGRAALGHWLEQELLARTQETLARRGFWIVLLLRINPLTSSDLVSYAAGLTAMPLWHLLLGTLLGMAPLCFAQAYLAQELLAAAPGLIDVLAVLAAVYVLVAVWILARYVRPAGPRQPDRN